MVSAAATFASALPDLLCSPLPLGVRLSSWVGTNVLLAVLALPHLLYAFVWTNPKAWLRVFGKQSVQAFAACGYIGKVLQFASCFVWAWALQPTGLCLRHPLSLSQLLLGGLLVAYGQALNLGTYRAIGTRGVYYGCRLGHRIPWVDRWPFSAVRHPQYTGSVLSVWGVLLLLWSVLPAAKACGVAFFWSCLYVFSALVENYL